MRTIIQSLFSPSIFSCLTLGAALLLGLVPLSAHAPTISLNPKQSAPSPKPGWVLTFDDEFNGTSLDTAKWTVYDYASDIGGEEQYYVPDEVSVQDGFVRLKSEKRSFGGREYTSGEIRTRDKFGQKYGLFEFRARLPRSAGTWSAEYLIAESEVWPPEIDAEEYLGRQPEVLHLTNHFLSLERWNRPDGTYHTEVDGPIDWTQWHTFAVDWEPGRVTWIVDGQLRGTTPDTPPDRAHVSDVPMYVRINTALGGWGGDLTGGVWPQFHDVDWVRVWRKASQPPPVNAGVDGEASMPNASVKLKGTACNPMGTARATWSVVNGPGSVKFSNVHALSTSAAFAKSGAYTLRLSVHDGSVGASDTMRVLVNPANVLPIAANADAYSIANSLWPGLHVSGGEDTLQLGERPLNGNNRNDSRESMKAYLAFDTARVPFVSRAVLRLYGGLRYDGSTEMLPCAVFGIKGADWNEKQGEWKSAPRLGPKIAVFSVGSTVHHGTERWHDIDVTRYVRAQEASGTTTVSFTIVPQDTAGALWAFFHSREAQSGKPRLVLTP